MFRPDAPKAERRDDVATLQEFIAKSTERYRDEGIPIDQNGRIDMRAYGDLYSDIPADLKRDEEWKEKWKTENQNSETRERTDGEKLEMLAFAIFMKHLGPNFVVAHASEHDDRKNKVDTILLDRKTGNLVCAFDEVGDISGIRYEQKQKIVQDHNLQGGASLKYGLAVNFDGDEAEVIPSTNTNLPLFYIALPKDRIDKGLGEFIPGETSSDFEERLFQYFIGTISAQINGLELYSRRLHPTLKEKLDAFKEIVSALNSGRTEK